MNFNNCFFFHKLKYQKKCNKNNTLTVIVNNLHRVPKMVPLISWQ